MLRRFVRRGTAVLTLTIALSLALVGAAPAAAQRSHSSASAWSWLAWLWQAATGAPPPGQNDATTDRGAGLDPAGG